MKLTRLTLLTAALALATAASFAACNGDDDDDENEDTTPVATRTASNGDGRTPAADPTEDEPGGNEGTSGDVDEIKELAEKFVDATFTANYEVTGAPEESFGDGSITLTKDGADRFRFDLVSSEGEIIFIQTPEQSASCLAEAGELGELLELPAGQGVCFSQALGEQGLGNLAEDLQEFVEGDVEVLETSEREIAGETVKCYLTREASEEVTNVCINDDGILLAVESPDGSKLEATDYSTEVDDSSFELPYELRELPTG